MTTAVAQQHGGPWRPALASTIGSILEYYDFFVYGPLAALVFPDIFFPASESGVATLLSLGTFAVGFLARPFGGVVVGHFGDRVGRKRMLITTFMITGVVTFAIGLLPTYAQVGVLAPVLLVSLRFLQGVGLGGEWGGAALLTVEHAPTDRRGFFGSLVQAGAPIGVILSSGTVAILTAVLSREQLLGGGWRIPFLLSVVLILVGLLLRLQVEESPEFERLRVNQQQARLPALEALQHYPKQILAAIGIHVGDTTIGFIQGIFVLGFATRVLGLDATTVLVANITGNVFNLLITPIVGVIGDRVGRKRVLIVGALLLAAWAFPMFWLIESRSLAALFVAYIVGSIITGVIFSPQPAYFAELFDARIRYSGMSIGFQVATILGGGFGPIIAQALQNSVGGQTWPVSVYLIIVAAIVLVATLTVRPTASGSTIVTAPPTRRLRGLEPTV